jgi:hypothetical protein
MARQWIKRLGQHTTKTTERLYVRVLEDVEVLIGLMVEGVEAWLAGMLQLGVALGQCVAKTAGTGTRGTVARSVWDRLAWLWRHLAQLQSQD